MATSLGTANPFRYRGYYYDTETSFYYLSSRYYDPQVCRFLNADGIIGANGDMQAYNLYAYCSSNPVNHSDPSGYGYYCVLCGSTTSHDNKNCHFYGLPMYTGRPSATPKAQKQNIVSTASDVVLGGTTYALSQQKYTPKMYTDSKGMAAFYPKGSTPKPLLRFPKTVNALNKASMVMTVATTGYEVAQTWTEKNSNTTADRWAKTGIQIGGTAAAIGVGYAATALLNCWNPVGWGMLAVGAIAVVGVSVVSSIVISKGQQYAYGQLGIE